ncbi:MAG: GFA family protein [Gammaproteobacteria bacterium]|nr:GFA family protein [Gammaproteobacteria bacterium]
MDRGSCLCGTAQFEAGPFDAMEHCHCSMCRRHHGAMFATFLAGKPDAFRWISGEDRVVTYQSSANGLRPFCRICGSVVPVVLPHLGMSFVPAGNLEGDPGLRPQFHMFAGSVAAWFPITDALPQSEKFPPGLEERVAVEAPALRPARPGIVRGHCLCGDVAFELAGQPEFVQNCHCSRCRRARSAAHATNAFFRREQLTWTRGEERVENFALPGAKRFGQAFCRRCGSPAPRVVASTGYVVVPCGSLDDPPGRAPRGHIFVGSKAPWHEITDGLPQWEELPA